MHCRSRSPVCQRLKTLPAAEFCSERAGNTDSPLALRCRHELEQGTSGWAMHSACLRSPGVASHSLITTGKVPTVNRPQQAATSAAAHEEACSNLHQTFVNLVGCVL